MILNIHREICLIGPSISPLILNFAKKLWLKQGLEMAFSTSLSWEYHIKFFIYLKTRVLVFTALSKIDCHTPTGYDGNTSRKVVVALITLKAEFFGQVVVYIPRLSASTGGDNFGAVPSIGKRTLSVLIECKCFSSFVNRFS